MTKYGHRVGHVLMVVAHVLMVVAHVLMVVALCFDGVDHGKSGGVGHGEGGGSVERLVRQCAEMIPSVS